MAIDPAQNCHVGAVNGRLSRNGLWAVRQSTYMALQAVSDQVNVSKVCREEERILLARKFIMIGGHRNSFSAGFWRKSRFIDLVQSVMNYSMTVNGKYNVQFFQAQTFSNACNMQ